MVKRKKQWLIGYAAVLLLICTFVPWQGKIPASVGNTGKSATVELGYHWLLQPPLGAKRVNGRRLAAEIIVVTAIAGAGYWLACKKDKKVH